MFTGLVQTTGVVQETRARAESRRLVIAASLADGDRILGASVAISGVCLTVIDSSPAHFEAEAAFETLRLTTLGQLRQGSRVNLEPALRVGDPLGGHLVSGHVDGVGRLLRVEARGEARQCWISMPPDISRFVAAKGSICIDGVSLTVNEVTDDTFAVGLIAHTLGATTLGELSVGDAVNLEVDILARHVARLLEVAGTGMATATGTENTGAGSVTIESLSRAGFLGPQDNKGRR